MPISVFFFGLGSNSVISYQQLPPSRSAKLDEESAQGPVELVTVPALGAEWGKDELKGMTKRGRKEEKSENRRRKWKAFNRGQYGLFGSKWLTRRTIVFVIFGLCVVYVFFFFFFFFLSLICTPRASGFHANRLFSQHWNCARLCHPARTWLRHQWDEPSNHRNGLV